MEHAYITESHTVADEVKIDLDVLRPLMLNRVGGEVRSRDAVAVDDGGPCRRAPNLLEKLPEPT